MADLHYTDDEQVERIKAWWSENGRSVIFGVVLAIGVVVGVNYWRDHERSVAEQASLLYERAAAGLAGDKVLEAQAVGDKLIEEFPDSPYAGKAALLLAQAQYANNDRAGAEARLRWALEHAAESGTEHAARLHLARLLLEQDKLSEARQLLQVKQRLGFDSHYLELEGDIARREGRHYEAAAAYRAALESLPKGSTYADVLNMKLDAVGGRKE